MIFLKFRVAKSINIKQLSRVRRMPSLQKWRGPDEKGQIFFTASPLLASMIIWFILSLSKPSIPALLSFRPILAAMAALDSPDRETFRLSLLPFDCSLPCPVAVGTSVKGFLEISCSIVYLKMTKYSKFCIVGHCYNYIALSFQSLYLHRIDHHFFETLQSGLMVLCSSKIKLNARLQTKFSITLAWASGSYKHKRCGGILYHACNLEP